MSPPSSTQHDDAAKQQDNSSPDPASKDTQHPSARSSKPTNNDQEEPFPWSLGVYDSHCHPTDTMSQIPSIPHMKTRALTVMATRNEDQTLVDETARKYAIQSPDPQKWTREECIVPCFGWHPWFSHMMYLDDDDDDDEADTESPNSSTNPDSQASEPKSATPKKELTGAAKIAHYQRILRPSRPSPLSASDHQTFSLLPNPQPLSTFLCQTRAHILSFPYALIGEIGLDRQFRIPAPWDPSSEAERDAGLTRGGREGRRLTPFRVDLGHQKAVFREQLRLAGELGVGVSVHGVQAHGLVYEVLAELWRGHERAVPSKRARKKMESKQRRDVPDGQKDGSASSAETEISDPSHPSAGDEEDRRRKRPLPYPPRICLHSYSGTPSTLSLYHHPSIPAEIYISLSSAINLPSLPPPSPTTAPSATDPPTPPAFAELVRAVPDDRLLVESDLHVAGPEMDARMMQVVRRVCAVRGWGLREGVCRLGANWRGFVFGDGGERVDKAEERGGRGCS